MYVFSVHFQFDCLQIREIASPSLVCLLILFCSLTLKTASLLTFALTISPVKNKDYLEKLTFTLTSVCGPRIYGGCITDPRVITSNFVIEHTKLDSFRYGAQRARSRGDLVDVQEPLAADQFDLAVLFPQV